MLISLLRPFLISYPLPLSTDHPPLVVGSHAPQLLPSPQNQQSGTYASPLSASSVTPNNVLVVAGSAMEEADDGEDEDDTSSPPPLISLHLPVANTTMIIRGLKGSRMDCCSEDGLYHDVKLVHNNTHV